MVWLEIAAAAVQTCPIETDRNASHRQAAEMTIPVANFIQRAMGGAYSTASTSIMQSSPRTNRSSLRFIWKISANSPTLVLSDC
jgi:hypothetical protein